eukprot:scaffold16051_cov111-Isochrysis_galbana.AAC.6
MLAAHRRPQDGRSRRRPSISAGHGERSAPAGDCGAQAGPILGVPQAPPGPSWCTAAALDDGGTAARLGASDARHGVRTVTVVTPSRVSRRSLLPHEQELPLDDIWSSVHRSALAALPRACSEHFPLFRCRPPYGTRGQPDWLAFSPKGIGEPSRHLEACHEHFAIGNAKQRKATVMDSDRHSWSPTDRRFTPHNLGSETRDTLAAARRTPQVHCLPVTPPLPSLSFPTPFSLFRPSVAEGWCQSCVHYNTTTARVGVLRV